MEDFGRKKKRKKKVVKGFAVDEDIYSHFKKECKDRNISMSSMVQEFLKRSVSLLKSKEGGEVVFGVEGDNWKQPEKVVYDGVEITERDGIRKLKWRQHKQ